MQQKASGEHHFAPFIIAFIVTLLLLSGVLATVVISRQHRAATASITGQQETATTYLPRKEDRLIMLIAAAENSTVPPDSYLLAGFLPDKGSIALCLLPPKTMIITGEQSGTIDELYARGGIGYTAKLVGDYLGIPIERSGYIELAGVRRLMEEVGYFEYEVQVELDYPMHQRQVAINRGKQLLDGRKVMDILAYPAYKNGEQERSDRGVMLLTQMVNAHLPDCKTERGDLLVQSFLNNATTDISMKDYEARKAPTRFLAKLKLPAATAVYVNGALSRDYGSFLLTESCRARLTSVYGGS